MKKTALVTGATDGIGWETARGLVQAGMRVIVHGRNLEKATAARSRLLDRLPSADVVAVWGDFSKLAEVRSLVRQVQEAAPRLEVLINNAGLFAQERSETEDGFELSFQVNHLAHFLLTCGLKAALPPGARVISVSSIAHTRGIIRLADLQMSRGFSGYGAYAASKLANVLFTFELARRAARGGILANCLHPGVISTKLLREGFGSTGDTVESGARTSLYLATSPELDGVSGRYFVDSEIEEAAPTARDPLLQKAFWEESAKLTGVDW